MNEYTRDLTYFARLIASLGACVGVFGGTLFLFWPLPDWVARSSFAVVTLTGVALIGIALLLYFRIEDWDRDTMVVEGNRHVEESPDQVDAVALVMEKWLEQHPEQAEDLKEMRDRLCGDLLDMSENIKERKP